MGRSKKKGTKKKAAPQMDVAEDRVDDSDDAHQASPAMTTGRQPSSSADQKNENEDSPKSSDPNIVPVSEDEKNPIISAENDATSSDPNIVPVGEDEKNPIISAEDTDAMSADESYATANNEQEGGEASRETVCTTPFSLTNVNTDITPAMTEGEDEDEGDAGGAVKQSTKDDSSNTKDDSCVMTEGEDEDERDAGGAVKQSTKDDPSNTSISAEAKDEMEISDTAASNAATPPPANDATSIGAASESSIGPTEEDNTNQSSSSSRVTGFYQSIRKSLSVRGISSTDAQEEKQTDGAVSNESSSQAEEDEDEGKNDDDKDVHSTNRERGLQGGVVSGVSKTLSVSHDSSDHHLPPGTTQPIVSNLSAISVLPSSSLEQRGGGGEEEEEGDENVSTQSSQTPVTANKSDMNLIAGEESAGIMTRPGLGEELGSEIDLTESPVNILSSSRKVGDSQEEESSAAPSRLWFIPMSLFAGEESRGGTMAAGGSEDDNAEGTSSRRRSSFWWNLDSSAPESGGAVRHALPSERPRASYPLRRSVSRAPSDRNENYIMNLRIKLNDGDSGTAEQSSEDTFQAAIRIPQCKVQDVVDMAARPDMLLQWCESLESLEVRSAHETHLSASDLGLSRTSSVGFAASGRSRSSGTKQFDAEWIEASATFRPPGETSKGCLRKCHEGIARSSTRRKAGGDPRQNGKLTLFVERRRRQIALTLSNFEGCEVSHTLNFVQTNNDVHVSDMVCITSQDTLEASSSRPTSTVDEDYDAVSEEKDEHDEQSETLETSCTPSSDSTCSTCFQRIISCPADCLLKVIGPVPSTTSPLEDHMEQSMSSMKQLSHLMTMKREASMTSYNDPSSIDDLSMPLLGQSGHIV
jgi:hypothetical protein